MLKKLNYLLMIILLMFVFISCKEKHIHKFDEWVVVSDATCTESGEQTRFCACGESETEIIDLTGHIEVIDEAVDVTCLTEGKTEGSHCSVCGEIFIPQVIIPKLEHTEIVDEAIVATCTKEGKTEGSHCSVCSTVIIPQNVIPAIPHVESKWIVDIVATIDSVGKRHTECVCCGVQIHTEIIPIVQLSKSDIISKLQDSVIKVICYDYDGKTEISQGSGFFIDSQGTFITNAHVIEDCYYIKVQTRFGLTYDVDAICDYNYTYSDYAICKVKNYYLSQPVEFSSSANVGDTVYALGYPNDAFIMSTTSGIITSTDTVDGTKNFYSNTAKIDHGSSGGVLVDAKGRVLGITTGILEDGEYAALKYQDFKFDAERIHISGTEPLKYFHTVKEYNLSSFSMSNYFDIYIDVISYTQTSVYYNVSVRLKDRYRNAKILLDSYGSATITVKLETIYDYYETMSYGTYHQNKTTNDTIYLRYYSTDDLIYGKSASCSSSIFIFNDYYSMKKSYEAEFGILQSGTILFFD